MNKYNHLIREKRDTIQYMLDKGYNFIQIGKSIEKDRTTVAKEIKRNRYIKSYYFDVFDSRSGVDITPQIIEQIENIIVPLIKNKKQSINQVYANHSDILYFSKTTFYSYVHNGILSLCDLNLPKKVIYKPRKNKNRNYKRKLALLKNRSYEDYIHFTSIHTKMNKCQMDTVEGNKNSNKCLLTLIIVDTTFMLIRLLDDKTINSVNEQFDILKEKLGIKLFSKIFRIVLTDNGSEFFDPKHIEYDYSTGRKTTNVFYCKPYSSWQKGCIEKNHEYIRKIFPKGTSFDSFSDEQILKLENIINNIPRKSLNNKTPKNRDFINIINIFVLYGNF